MRKILVPLFALAAVTAAMPAQALVVVAGSGDINDGDASQSPRLFRDGVASSWAAPKAFPGTSGGSYFYDLVNVSFAPNAAQTVYYRISATNQTAFSPHAAAYKNSFNAGDISQNYLGDVGFSPAAGETLSFEVIVAAGDSLVLNFHQNFAGTYGSYDYVVEAFSDVNGGENFGAVPEPATWAMMIGGLGLVGVSLRRQKAKVSFAAA